GIARMAMTIINQWRCFRSSFIIARSIVEAALLSRKRVGGRLGRRNARYGALSAPFAEERSGYSALHQPTCFSLVVTSAGSPQFARLPSQSWRFAVSTASPKLPYPSVAVRLSILVRRSSFVAPRFSGAL